MFRCYFCEKITPPGTTRHSVVIEIREKQYTKRRREQKRGGFRGRGRDRDRDRDESVLDRGGRGMEIMREVDACPECAAEHHDVTVVTAAPPPAAEQSDIRQDPDTK